MANDWRAIYNVNPPLPRLYGKTDNTAALPRRIPNLHAELLARIPAVVGDRRKI